MKKTRLDQLMVQKGLVETRSQAENYIKLGQVKVNGQRATKPGYFVADDTKVQFGAKEQYVSRAALKLASVADVLGLDFKSKTVLDVGSSTGGFTDYSLQHGAQKVIAVDVGTEQLHPRLRADERVELHEKTDIRNVRCHSERGSAAREAKTEIPDQAQNDSIVYLEEKPDIVLMDVSFISLTKVLPHISKLISHNTQVVAMCKPQFEAEKRQLNKGVVKNSAQRREILKNFETWLVSNGWVISKKSDSAVAGGKGNVERFYLLTKAL